MALLEVKKLSVEFSGFKAVDHISYDVEQGEVVGIVGESGSGKSISSLGIMGFIDFPGNVTAKALHFDGKNLQQLSNKMRRKNVDADVAMIFQDPMTSLNPCFTIGYQIIETLKINQDGNKRELKARAIELLKLVGIPDAENRLNVYPHQLSGGMSRQSH